MEGPKRNEDRLNIIGIVAVGICGSVFVYVSVVLLQAFYMDETATVETIAEHQGQGNTYRTLRAAQRTYVTEYGRNAGGPDQPQTYRIPVDQAMALVVEQGPKDAANLVPVAGRSNTATIKAVFGRPQPLQAPAPAAPAVPGGPAGAAPETAAPAGATSAPAPTTGAPAGAGATPAPAAMTTRPVDAQQPAGLAPPTAAPVPAPGATPPAAPTPAPKAAPKAPAKAPAKRAQGGNAP